MTATSPPVARADTARDGGRCWRWAGSAGPPGDRGGAVPQHRDGQEPDPHGGQVVRPARRHDHDVAAGADRPAAVAGQPPRHGPAHRLAPLDRVHAALDRPHARHAGRARLRAARPAPGVRDVPGAGRGGRLAARDVRRRDHRRRSAVASARYARRRLQYETWHAVHMALYVAILLALVHQLLEGTTFAVVAARRRALVDDVGAGPGRAAGRAGDHPVAAQRLPPVPVAAVVPESDNVVSVYVTGRHLDRLPARAGQFCIWRFPEHNRLVAGEPVLAVRGPGRAVAAADGQGRRRDQRRAAPASRSATRSSPKVPTAPSPPCTRSPTPPC